MTLLHRPNPYAGETMLGEVVGRFADALRATAGPSPLTSLS